LAATKWGLRAIPLAHLAVRHIAGVAMQKAACSKAIHDVLKASLSRTKDAGR
jgi:hypothetical protein